MAIFTVFACMCHLQFFCSLIFDWMFTPGVKRIFGCTFYFHSENDFRYKLVGCSSIGG